MSSEATTASGGAAAATDDLAAASRRLLEETFNEGNLGEKIGTGVQRVMASRMRRKNLT